MNKMEKLTIKELAPYLPYGLNCHCMGLVVDSYADEIIHVIVEIVGLNTDYVEIHEIGRTVTEQYDYLDVKPILRPLSDLTKEIEVNGEKLVPIHKFKKMSIDFSCIHFDPFSVYIPNGCNYFELDFFDYYNVTQKLFEWHFDVFGLIEKGLAIDINTL